MKTIDPLPFRLHRFSEADSEIQVGAGGVGVSIPRNGPSRANEGNSATAGPRPRGLEGATAGDLSWIRRAGSGLLGLVLFLSLSVGMVFGADYSSWLKNISSSGDPESLYIHNNVKIAISGQYVHLAWVGGKKDWSGNVLFYTRSANGGKTFATPRILAKDAATDFFKLSFPPEMSNFAADGNCVHIFYTVGWPTKLQYLRSIDNGATFAKPVTFSNAYRNYTYSLTTELGRVIFAWGSTGGDSPYPRSILCSYSDNNGATFKTTQVAYAEGSPYYMGVVDAVRSGNYVYILTQTTDENWFSSQSRLFLRSSWDGGATFKKPVKVTVPAAAGGDYATRTQDAQYTPNLSAMGKTVNITWLNIDNPGSFDGWVAPTLRTRRSTDGGLTLGRPLILHTYPEGYHSGANAGSETIVGNGAYLYITSVLSDTPAGTYVWRSADAGASWSPTRQISTGGWWPMIQIDPADARRVHVANSSYFLSTNSGATFNGGVNPHMPFGNWDSPQMKIDDQGVAHYAAASGGAYTNEIFYRRLAPPQNPELIDTALTCVGLAVNTRSDNMQVPASPDLNFTKAMTVECWLRRNSDELNTAYHEPIVAKKRTYGNGSYELGAWDQAQIYARIVTDQAPDTYYGVWLGSGVLMEKGRWYHVALTYDAALAANNVKLFVNGQLKNQTDLKGSILTTTMDSPLQIGNTGYSAGGFSIDELRLWNKALKQLEIGTKMSVPRFGNEPGLTAYFNFNGTTKDITGHGNNGLLMFRETFTRPGAMQTTKPEIAVEQPLGNELVSDQGSRSFGKVRAGNEGPTKTFTITNQGTAMLNNIAITKTGSTAAFDVTSPEEGKLAPGQSTTFKVTFQPGSVGLFSATLRIASNDPNENPFLIEVTGEGIRR